MYKNKNERLKIYSSIESYRFSFSKRKNLRNIELILLTSRAPIKINPMKYLSFLILFYCLNSIAQELPPPTFSVNSGFYTETIELTIDHPQNEVIILYSLDGSDPHLENLNGKSWNYKSYYPLLPGDSFGDIQKDTIWTYQYHEPLILENRATQETALEHVYTTIQKHNIRAMGELFKGNVVRAKAYDPDTEEYSETITGNYFITELGTERYSYPVVAISVDNERFYGYEEGINVPGILFDNWREANPDAILTGWEPANYRLTGEETESRINFNYFIEGEEVLNHDAGMRINGGYTRAMPNKSLRLYAKGGYGESNFRYAFFDDYAVNKFKRLILRNSGNDASSSFFRDAFMHKMAANLNFDVQESKPVVLFINGEYNGLRNLRERYDKKYFNSIHDIPEDELDFLENHVEVKEGDLDFYQEMIDFFNNNSFQDNEIYNQGITYMDPVNFTDYYATNIYAGNNDWPSNNYLFYRHKTAYNPDTPSPVKDGRFRWLLKDLDRGFFLNQLPENGYEGNILEWATRNIESTLLIRRLLENENYKKYFINRFADLLNTTFKENRVFSIINEFQGVYIDGIEENGRRWHTYTAMPQRWLQDVERMKIFAMNRPYFQRQHIIEKFDLEGTFELILNVSNDEHGYIHLNTIAIHPDTDGIREAPYPWMGVYFQNVPVTLRAVPEENYVFSHWSGTINSNEPEITLSLSDDTYVKANFIHESVGVTDMETTSFKIYPNPAGNQIYIQSSIDWETYVVYDLQGRSIKSGSISNATVDLQGMASGTYFIQLKLAGLESKFIRVLKQ